MDRTFTTTDHSFSRCVHRFASTTEVQAWMRCWPTKTPASHVTRAYWTAPSKPGGLPEWVVETVPATEVQKQAEAAAAKPTLEISEAIRAMSDADLETRAAELSVSWGKRQLNRARREEIVALAEAKAKQA
jgi:hypothetical protein